MENIFDLLYEEVVQEATRHHMDFTGQSHLKGNQAEIDFGKLAKQLGYTWKQGTPHNDRIDHFDGFLHNPKNGKTFKVEVKSSKSERCPNDVLLEFKGGHGHKGWMYGKADFIAHEVLIPNQHFCLFKRDKLVQYAEQKCKIMWENNKLNFNPANLVKYTCEAIAPLIYNRHTDQSIITRIPLQELQKEVDFATFKFA